MLHRTYNNNIKVQRIKKKNTPISNEKYLLKYCRIKRTNISGIYLPIMYLIFFYSVPI